MKFPFLPLLLAAGWAGIVSCPLSCEGAESPARVGLPPKPVAALTREQEAALEQDWALAQAEFAAVRSHPCSADAAIFLKAVRYALDFDEWYDKKAADGEKKAAALLEEARKRIAALKENRTPWMDGSGQKVLGFYSGIDGSPQPYGVEIPEGLEWGAGKKPVPMWIWLHGRGDTATDLHFIYSRLTAKKPGQFQPARTLVIHPFGRYCNGWKSAGETDVLEARDAAVQRFHVDGNRVALAGFSMGGAGAWHLGAHFADQWACVHTGAGFVDVKRYQKLTPGQMPPWYEQALWGVYDVPACARNFANVPLISYSGEQDKQRDSADYMTEVLAAAGIQRPHLIGPGMGHKYHPDSLREVQAWVEKAVAQGRHPSPRKVVLQTRCSRYGKMFWVTAQSLQRAWEDARVEAEISDDFRQVIVRTSNVAALELDLALALGSRAVSCRVMLDGQEVRDAGWGFLRDPGGRWAPASCSTAWERKGWGFDGPADQVFQGPFIVVLPDAPCAHPAVDQWVKTESAHFIERWRSLMRGDPVVKKPEDLTPDERAGKGAVLCLWGDRQGNSALAAIADRLPIAWDGPSIRVGERTFDSATHVPVLACQFKTGPEGARRIVLNTGLTFREAHDRTNSLQNPKLPDWAILDIATPPDAETAGQVVAADFFDEHWRVRGPAAGP